MLGVYSQTSRISKCVISTFIFVVFLGLTVSPAADTPQAVVQSGTDKVLQLMKEHSGSTRVRREKIRNVVDEYFDFTEMSRRALGPRWKTVSPEQQQEFTRDFSQLIFNVYIRKVEKYTNEKVTYKDQKLEGENAVVDVLVVGDKTGEIGINYHLTRRDGSWKVHDVAVEGVDLAMNYRSQFNSILATSSFDDLLRQLKQKNAQG